MPQSTVLSTVWKGPADGRSTGNTDERPRPVDPEAATSQPRLLRWLFAPTTRRRALIISVVAALACGGLFAVDGADERRADPSFAAPGESVEPARGNLSSEAVAGDEVGQPASADPGSTTWEAISADERMRFTAVPSPAAAWSWLLEATVVDVADTAPIVRFTVNGVAVEEVEQPPYRLLLGPELRASFPDQVEDGQPLVVTASALWPDGGAAAGPATVVLPN